MADNLKILVLIVIVFAVSSCFEEAVVFDTEPSIELALKPVLKFNDVSCSYDAEMEMLRYYLPGDSTADFFPAIEFNDKSELYFEGFKLKNKERNLLGFVEINHQYQIEIKNKGVIKKLNLIFTNLPIVQISCDQTIYDEPKSLARIQINSSIEKEQFSSFTGIELRGRYSREYIKKSMGFALWEKMTGKVEYSSKLLGLHKNSEWILGAAFIDLSRIRNLVSFEIWNGLQETKDDHLGIHSKMVEVFLNNKFRGIYIFSELLNAECLEVGNEAFLYKGIDWADGATKFERYNSEISMNQFWNGWEQKIPDRNEKICWTPLKKLYELLVDGDDEEFKQNIINHFDFDNLIDYYLFLNLTVAIDNTGKNSFLYAKDENTPFQYIPWDLDGSWGILFDGSKVGSNSILTNSLYERFLETNPDNFRGRMKARWFYLRENHFSEENIIAVFDRHFKQMNSSDIIQKENLIWDVNLNMKEEQEYIKSWVADRLSFLDNYFDGI